YKGADNEIGIDLFIESLTNYSIVAQEISSQLHRDSKLDIKIKALEKGSFIVTLEHIIQNVPNLFSKDNISYASGLITVIGGIYSFKK
ncbi:MAG: hypothetical protein ORN58_03645, partial [Sediminibacterium sp.]|nr:hypothetical protein [Sediminibacterium sp.]